MPEEDESLRLEWALTLGWKTVLLEEVSEPFVQAAAAQDLVRATHIHQQPATKAPVKPTVNETQGLQSPVADA
jgi:hypothetical protein